MKHLRSIAGAHSSHVELVEIDGKEFVLKTAEPEEVMNEHLFQQELKKAGMPSLWTSRDDLPNNQLLLEFVPNSPSLNSNLTVDMCKKWGSTVKTMHSITQSQTSRIDDDGNSHVIDWKRFLVQELYDAKERKARKNSDISDHAFEVLEREIEKIETPDQYSLIHADLHSNNVLIRGGELVLFDKGSAVFFGDPLYDLPLVLCELASENDQSPELWSPFLEEYGKVNEINLLRYSLLRFVGRYPNPFTLQLKNLIETFVIKLQ